MFFLQSVNVDSVCVTISCLQFLIDCLVNSPPPSPPCPLPPPPFSFSPMYFPSPYIHSASLPSFLPSFLLYNGLTMTPIRKGAVMTAMAVMVGKLRLGVQLQLRPSPQRWYLCDCQTSAVWGSDIWSTTYDIWYWISSATAVWHMCSRQCSIPVFPPTKKLLSSCDPQHQPVSNTVSHSIFNAGPICLRCRPCAKPAGLLSL